MKSFKELREGAGEMVGGKFMSYATMKAKGIKPKKSAFASVKDKIKKEVGKSGYVSKDNPRKPQSDAEKAKVAAHNKKLAKQDHRDPTEKASDGRYSDRYSNRGSD